MVSEVVSVDHDIEWVENIRNQARPNNTIVHVKMNGPVEERFQPEMERFFAQGLAPMPGPDPGRNMRAGLLSREFAAYASELLRFPSGYFDIVVIDGMARVLTAWLAARQVKKNGFILFDNSDRIEYEKGYEILYNSRFKRIDFWGTGPVNSYEWCTSIFTQTLSIF